LLLGCEIGAVHEQTLAFVWPDWSPLKY
jgi:hypothetical protein